MSLKLNSTGGGSVTLQEPNTASALVVDLPNANGTLIATGSSGVVTPSMLTQPLTLGTAQASTSGTSISFTGIPSWVKRLTFMLRGVSTNGTSNWLIQLGTSSGFTTTGYFSYSCRLAGSSVNGGTNITTGIGIVANSAAYIISGSVIISKIDGDSWVAQGMLTESSSNNGFPVTGSVALAGEFDRIRLTTVNGTDAFDAGLINIIYEG